MNNKLIAKSFLWMAIGLLVTFVTGFFASTSYNIMDALFVNKLYIPLAIIEIILVIILSAFIYKMSPAIAKVSFLFYSFISGLAFSSIFIVFSVKYIVYVFLVAAFLFGLFGFIGYVTKINLNKIGTILLMVLIGAIILSLLNAFVLHNALDIPMCILFLVIFLGITAWDMQKLKNMDEYSDNAAIYGALQLYLDFINILISLLRLFKRND